MAKKGRPTIYTKELVDGICERIACGESLRSVCRDEKTPALSVILRWLTEPDKLYFKEQYDQARIEQANTLVDECLDTAKEESDVARARLIIDTRKWFASKMFPKKYGDRTVLAGDSEQPLQMKIYCPKE
ncbi:MAG: hypothetical protein AB7P94_17225, partial [Steroidobacteraceae bacterium]